MISRMESPIGIILGQLGTPDAPTPGALRRYLAQFLGDPRVIEMNPIGRWLLLHLVILRRRPRISAELYRRIWKPEGSPLRTITRAQAEGLQGALGGTVRVAVGMRYGNPSMREAIESLLSQGAARILFFPLFPQYSGATTGSLCDEFFHWIPRRRVVPAVRVVPPYHGHRSYVEAVATVAREHLAALPWKPEKVLFSFHGLPESYVRSGEPYPDQARESARRIAAALSLGEGAWELAFQSRFGRQEWLKPYTDKTLARLGREGIRRIAVLCPGFIADCLETIDEIASVGLEQFRRAGGSELSLIPCVNTHPAWIGAMAAIAREELSGWLDGS